MNLNMYMVCACIIGKRQKSRKEPKTFREKPVV